MKLAKRIESACKRAEELLLDGLLIEQPADLFYFVGQWFSPAKLLLQPEGACLFINSRDFGQAQGNVPCKVVLEEKGILKAALQGMKKIGFDSAFVTVDKANLLHQSAPHAHWISISRPLKSARLYKDAEEIALLKQAARITFDGYLNLLKHVKEGISEQELALDFELRCRRARASKLSFEPIIAFGQNSAFPHYRAGEATLKKNQIALFDLGAVFGHYCGDMTRVFFFGQPQSELERFYELVRKAHDLAVAAIRPGVKLGELDRIVRAYFEQEGVQSLFTHSLGHGVGLEVHEYPLLRFDGEDKDLVLQPGMVFTIEPGLYLPGVGGVRYENTHVVTEAGSENLYAEA